MSTQATEIKDMKLIAYLELNGHQVDENSIVYPMDRLHGGLYTWN